MKVVYIATHWTERIRKVHYLSFGPKWRENTLILRQCCVSMHRHNVKWKLLLASGVPWMVLTRTTTTTCQVRFLLMLAHRQFLPCQTCTLLWVLPLPVLGLWPLLLRALCCAQRPTTLSHGIISTLHYSEHRAIELLLAPVEVSIFTIIW
jgi:hypothetical protein